MFTVFRMYNYLYYQCVRENQTVKVRSKDTIQESRLKFTVEVVTRYYFRFLNPIQYFC